MLASVLDPSAPQGQLVDYGQVQAHLAPALVPFVVALLVCLVLTGAALRLAPRLGFVSRPERDRDLHTRPIPFGGGLAMFAGFAAAALAAVPHDFTLAGVLGLCGLTALVFAADDRRPMKALLKLAFQVAVAVVAVMVFQLKISDLNLGHLQLAFGLLALPVTVLWIVGMQNTVNLLDGVDGLAAGVVAIVALILLTASASRMVLPGGGVDGTQLRALMLSAALAAVCLGFLLFNFNPARIFMGDSGAQFLGLALALLSILGVAKVAVAAALVVPVLALAVPILDTALAIVRRRRQGRSIAQADSRHLHHHLLKFGLSQRETCLVFYGATAILGAAGLTVFGHRRILGLVIVLMVVLLSTLLGERLVLWGRRVPVPGGRLLRLLLEGRAVR